MDTWKIGARHRERQFAPRGHHNPIKAMPLAGSQGYRARGGVQCGGALPQPEFDALLIVEGSRAQCQTIFVKLARQKLFRKGRALVG